MVRCPPEFASMARANGYVLEHRLVMAKSMGRPLRAAEVVHHIDHNKTNNDLSNLQLFASHREHWVSEHLEDVLSAKNAAASGGTGRA
jgi:hypothetical protein